MEKNQDKSLEKPVTLYGYLNSLLIQTRVFPGKQLSLAAVGSPICACIAQTYFLCAHELHQIRSVSALPPNFGGFFASIQTTACLQWLMTDKLGFEMILPFKAL